LRKRRSLASRDLARAALIFNAAFTFALTTVRVEAKASGEHETSDI
jgi:hypothetical protein